MEQGSPIKIAVVATDEWISRLLGDYVESCGWSAELIHPIRIEASVERVRSCDVVLCDLDIWPTQLAVVRASGLPLVYFSSRMRLRDVEVPTDAAAAFDLPPKWSEIDELIRSLLGKGD